MRCQRVAGTQSLQLAKRFTGQLQLGSRMVMRCRALRRFFHGICEDFGALGPNGSYDRRFGRNSRRWRLRPQSRSARAELFHTQGTTRLREIKIQRFLHAYPRPQRTDRESARKLATAPTTGAHTHAGKHRSELCHAVSHRVHGTWPADVTKQESMQ